nr:hypothetical protein CFP56_24403 [Quercus suber]
MTWPPTHGKLPAANLVDCDTVCRSDGLQGKSCNPVSAEGFSLILDRTNRAANQGGFGQGHRNREFTTLALGLSCARRRIRVNHANGTSPEGKDTVKSSRDDDCSTFECAMTWG